MHLHKSLTVDFRASKKLQKRSVALPIVLFIATCTSLFAQSVSRGAPNDSAPTAGISGLDASSSSRSETLQPNQPRSPAPALQDQQGGEPPSPSSDATIVGTVTDIDDVQVLGATVILQANDSDYVRTIETNENGFFRIGDIPSAHTYHVTVNANGFAKWESSVLSLEPGEFKILDVGKLQVEEVRTSITVRPEESEEIAAQQVKAAEKQRAFLIVPNFYAVYTANPEPLTAKLKFSLAFAVSRDPFTLGGVTTLAAIDQATMSPRYVEGARGYAERFGANYANALTDIMLDGAIFPVLLHQDPRYFYQGTGTKRSRAFHVISSLVVAKGDNGRWQPNYSNICGDLASSTISNLYYPSSNRGPGLVFQGFAIDTAVHLTIRMLDEFVLRPPKTSNNAPWNSNPHL